MNDTYNFMKVYEMRTLNKYDRLGVLFYLIDIGATLIIGYLMASGYISLLLYIFLAAIIFVSWGIGTWFLTKGYAIHKGILIDERGE